MTDGRVPCIGCGGLVPDIDGPSHRYMLASPGCWEAYTGLLGGALAGVDLEEPHGSLMVDAFAVQHPGVPSRQATQSVWVHLVTLYLGLERAWPPARLMAARRIAADSSTDLDWLDPPAAMGQVTPIDVASAAANDVAPIVRQWVDGAWAAWSSHHNAVRTRASEVERHLS